MTQRITDKMIASQISLISHYTRKEVSYDKWNISSYQLKIDGVNISRVSLHKGEFYDVLKGISDTLRLMEHTKPQLVPEVLLQ